MPTLPAPVKQQVNQLINGTLDDIKEAPKQVVDSGMEQFGLSNPPPPNPPQEDQTKILEDQDRQKTLPRIRELMKELEAEIEKKRQEREVRDQERQQEDQQPVAPPEAPFTEPALKQKRGLFGLGGKKKSAQGAFSNIQKSQAEMIGKRTGG